MGFILFVCISVAPCQADEEDYLNQVTRANDLYSSKQYKKAVDIYETLIAQGIENGFLHYNLGNAYFRLNNLGAAIFNYNQAKKLIPRFEDLEANFRYAIHETIDKKENSLSGLKSFIFWIDDFSKSEYVYVSLIANLLFWVTMMAWWYLRIYLLMTKT